MEIDEQWEMLELILMHDKTEGMHRGGGEGDGTRGRGLFVQKLAEGEKLLPLCL